MNDVRSEEPWESEIGDMLRGLPTVEPPQGFIDNVLDHRPRYAGRLLGLLATVSMGSLAALFFLGPNQDTEMVSPTLETFEQQHSSVEAGVLGAGSEGETLFKPIDKQVDSPINLPDNFERAGNFEASESTQEIFSREGSSDDVSVFIQPGLVDWASLSNEGLTVIDGNKAWVDRQREITVIQADKKVVTIVGLPEEEVVEVVQNTPQDSTGSQLSRMIADVIEQLGFPGVTSVVVRA